MDGVLLIYFGNFRGEVRGLVELMVCYGSWEMMKRVGMKEK